MRCLLLAKSGHAERPRDVRFWESGYRDRLRTDIASGHERADVTRVT